MQKQLKPASGIFNSLFMLPVLMMVLALAFTSCEDDPEELKAPPSIDLSSGAAQNVSGAEP